MSTSTPASSSALGSLHSAAPGTQVMHSLHALPALFRRRPPAVAVLCFVLIAPQAGSACSSLCVRAARWRRRTKACRWLWRRTAAQATRSSSGACPFRFRAMRPCFRTSACACRAARAACCAAPTVEVRFGRALFAWLYARRPVHARAQPHGRSTAAPQTAAAQPRATADADARAPRRGVRQEHAAAGAWRQDDGGPRCRARAGHAAIPHHRAHLLRRLVVPRQPVAAHCRQRGARRSARGRHPRRNHDLRRARR